MRLVVWLSVYDRRNCSTVSNRPSVTMPMTSTTSVDTPLWTSTLSTTSWKKIGVASAKSCTNSEATSTWPSGRL